MGAESLSGDEPYPEDEAMIKRLREIMAGGDLSLEEALVEYFRTADAATIAKENANGTEHNES